MNVTFVDLVIEECAFDGTDGSQAVVDVEACHSQETYGLVALHRVVFRKNSLIAASGVRMPSSSCSELEIMEVEITENVCSGEACGVHLGKTNRLENCVAFGNRMAATSGQQSSLLYGVASSNTTIRGFTVRGNKLTVIRIQDSSLSVSKTVFSRNSLDSRIADGMKSPCFHLVKSSAQIEDSVIFETEGFRGAAIFAEKTNVSVLNSSFINNVGSKEGGCVYLIHSRANFKHTNAANSSAGELGGFIYSWNSTVKLEGTSALTNSARARGGFAYIEQSNATLKHTNATSNSAGNLGGFMFAKNSKLKMEDTSALKNNAEARGGFAHIEQSNVTLQQTNATSNSAGDIGGFMFAKSSRLKLEDINALKNSAEARGGFAHIEQSNVTLQHTNATSNSAGDLGGFMFVWNSRMKMEDTSALKNSAQTRGGFAYIEQSNVTLQYTNATSNGAGDDGGFMYAWKSKVTAEHTTAVNSKSKHGSFVRAWYSSLDIAQSQFFGSSAEISGGFAAVSENSSLLIVDSAIERAKSKNGGAIWLQESHLVAHNLSILHCEADESGGGVYGFASSTVLCSDCKLNSNSAKEGQGGVIFLDADFEQNLALQLVQSHIENNVARMGGMHSCCTYSFLTICIPRWTLLRLQQ